MELYGFACIDACLITSCEDFMWTAAIACSSLWWIALEDLGEKNATDCGVKGRLLWAAAEKGSGTHL